MALFGEEFQRCTGCNHYEFKQQELVVIAKDPMSRTGDRTQVVRFDRGVKPVMILESHVIFVCANCGKELER